MIYIVLNALIFCFLIYYTHLIDTKIKGDTRAINSLAVSLLFLLIESGLFILTLLFKNFWIDSLTTQLMRIAFCFDVLFFVTLSFNFITIGAKRKVSGLKFIMFIIFVFFIYVIFRHFNSIDVDYENGIIIVSEYLFDGPAREFFPWSWFTLYTAVVRILIPVFCYVTLTLLQEAKQATQLEKYQTLVIGEGIVLMWLTNYAINFIRNKEPAFSLLFMFAYLFMIVVIFQAYTKTTVPSGKGIFVNIVKFLLSYIIPAIIVGVVCAVIQPQKDALDWKFITTFALLSAIVIFLAFKIADILSSSTKIYTVDYENALEKDLASIDYQNAEMDAVTAKMYDIFKRNVEASSMSVYILNGQEEFETAYSSNNTSLSIPVSNPIFDTLLNVNKSVVVWTEIDKEHDVSSIQNELTEFFEYTKSDALFILNEGHNIFGLITLGKKVSGDHYKEYDYKVFVKLYSYFFVFGYYMRNISNKEIIGVVNREIKMSSQIITSIQENIDHIKNNKVDVGLMMVPAHNIGGEFIDLIRLTDNRHLFVVGDLCGKGIAASMNMVILKSVIRTYLSEIHDFKELVVKINVFIRESLRKGTIFAGLFALVDFETDTMYYINCGIPALMMYTQVYNNVIEIQGSGHVLGFVKDISPFISVKTTKLNRGDIILACTDGMIQSHSLRGEQFGKERVQQALLDNSTYPAQRMAQFTFDGLLKFMSKEMEDDVSILILKYETTLDYQTEVEEKVKEPPIEGSIDVPSDATSPEVDESSGIPEAISGNAEIEVENTDNAEVAAEPIPEPGEEINEKPEEVPSNNDISSDMDLPDGFEMPDLSDLDDMMKEAGL